MTKKKTRKVAKPRALPLKVESVREGCWEGSNVNMECKEQLIELAQKLKQPIFIGTNDNELFFVYQGVVFYRVLDEDEVKELDYDEWVDNEEDD